MPEYHPIHILIKLVCNVGIRSFFKNISVESNVKPMNVSHIASIYSVPIVLVR